MKKIKFLAIGFVILGLLGCSGDWKKYENSEYGFSILYPVNWEYNEGLYNTAFLAKEPMKSPTDKFQSNINVVVTKLPQPLDLNTFFELNKDELMRNLQPINNVMEGEVYAGMMSGRWLSFEGRMKDIMLKVIVAVWIKDTTVYAITCSAPVQNFSQYEGKFFKVMRSLRVK